MAGKDYFSKTGRNAVKDALKPYGKTNKSAKKSRSSGSSRPSAKEMVAKAKASYAKDVEKAVSAGWFQTASGHFTRENPAKTRADAARNASKVAERSDVNKMAAAQGTGVPKKAKAKKANKRNGKRG